MKSFDRIFAAVIALILVIFAAANALILWESNNAGRPYRVEISRLAREIEENGISGLDLSACDHVTHIEQYGEDFYNSESDYVIREIGGVLYRFDYTASRSEKSGLVLAVDLILAVMAAVIIGVMLFIRQKILAPFDKLKELPYELSKGNLTAPIKESKSRFFGRFLWGVDLLRERLEQQKSRELALIKERNTLLLSLSHDIKTPLSAIKLYAKALSKGLYPEKEKQLEIADNINEKADEIERFVSQIVTASSEDLLELEVHNSEFYLSELMTGISSYYKEKLSLVQTEFLVERYSDCLLKGDLDRSVEVLQNIIENALKYGDGARVEIAFSDEDDCRLITIKNTGCTLPQNELPHIFDSFWRGSNAGNKPGSGLGLYICRQLMRKMNGEIFAEKDGDIMRVTAVFARAL